MRVTNYGIAVCICVFLSTNIDKSLVAFASSMSATASIAGIIHEKWFKMVVFGIHSSKERNLMLYFGVLCDRMFCTKFLKMVYALRNLFCCSRWRRRRTCCCILANFATYCFRVLFRQATNSGLCSRTKLFCLLWFRYVRMHVCMYACMYVPMCIIQTSDEFRTLFQDKALLSSLISVCMHACMYVPMCIIQTSDEFRTLFQDKALLSSLISVRMYVCMYVCMCNFFFEPILFPDNFLFLSSMNSVYMYACTYALETYIHTSFSYPLCPYVISLITWYIYIYKHIYINIYVYTYIYLECKSLWISKCLASFVCLSVCWLAVCLSVQNEARVRDLETHGPTFPPKYKLRCV